MKNAKLILIVLVLIVVGAFAFTRMGGNDSSSSGLSSGGESGQETSEGIIGDLSGSMMDLLKLGKAIKCTATFSDAQGSGEVVTYASGDKFFSESKMTGPDGLETQSNTIFDGEYSYIWGEAPTGEKMALKMKVDNVLEEDETLESKMNSMDSDKSYQNMQEQFNYKCSPWVPTPGKFTPPSDIDFLDFSETMMQFEESFNSEDPKSMEEALCVTCDLIQDEAGRAECRAELGC